MDNEHVLITENGELYHWGIKGMKWGQRRYQNKDGSLTPAGKKRYAEEEAALKSREKVIKNQERTKAKLAKLDAKKAELDAREKALDDPEKVKTTNDSATKQVAKQKSASDMDDRELRNVVNRLRNEEAYKDLSKKLGYDTPTTELDIKIAEMEKQKRYLELQRDIKALTPEKVSIGKKLINAIAKDVVGPAATSAGKKVLEKMLTDIGMDAVGKAVGGKIKKEAEKVAESAEKNAKKEATKKAWQEAYEAKKAAKAAEKETEKEAKETTKEAAKETKNSESSSNNKVHEGTVEGFGNGSKTTNQGKKWTNDSKIIDAEYYEIVNDNNTSSGRSYVSNYLALPAPGLPSPGLPSPGLPSPRDDD